MNNLQGNNHMQVIALKLVEKNLYARMNIAFKV